MLSPPHIRPHLGDEPHLLNQLPPAAQTAPAGAKGAGEAHGAVKELMLLRQRAQGRMQQSGPSSQTAGPASRQAGQPAGERDPSTRQAPPQHPLPHHGRLNPPERTVPLSRSLRLMMGAMGVDVCRANAVRFNSRQSHANPLHSHIF
jgi:hypothetical protein